MTTKELNDRIAQRQNASYVAIAKITSLNKLVLQYSGWEDDPDTASILLNIICASLTDELTQQVVDYSNSI